MEKQSNNQHNQIDISSFLEGTPQLYSSLFTAKNGSVIPVFSSNRTMESRYNPQSEAERLVEVTPSSSFYIVLGIGGGILIEKLLQKYPSSFFLCIEKDDDTLTFLHQLPLITELENNPHVKLTTIQNLSSDFEATYIPSLYLVSSLSPKSKSAGYSAHGTQVVASFPEGFFLPRMISEKA